MLSELSETDWDTSPVKINIGDHWRVLLCIVVGSLAATLILHAFFPHTSWFRKFTNGDPIGATVGMIPGTWWQLRDYKRRPRTSGWFVVVGILAWGLLAGSSIFRAVPDLYSQENELAQIRSLCEGARLVDSERRRNNASERIPRWTKPTPNHPR